MSDPMFNSLVYRQYLQRIGTLRTTILNERQTDYKRCRLLGEKLQSWPNVAHTRG